jgi:formamidopyrimidine-DNA glycosylase
MPELPDVTVYVEALEKRILNRILEKVRINSPFLLRTFDPPISTIEGKKVDRISRLGKRIVLGFSANLFLVIHLMIAGRFRWNEGREAPVPKGNGLAAFDFETGTLILTEASKKKRASLHLIQGDENLRKLHPGGMEVHGSALDEFNRILASENHTLKRALTDPRLFSGIGNAYSDEILHAARLSPVKLTSKLPEDEIDRLHNSVQQVLNHWTEVLREQFKDRFPGPGEITAFRPDFAVHGKFEKPCPVCGTPVQRIRYAENETNYCPTCQTGGKLLADRALSRLLKQDWPKSLEEFEERYGGESTGR